MLRRLFPNVYEGWIVVGSAAFMVLMVASTFFYGFGTIFNEVIDEFGWTVATTSLAFSLRSEAGGLAAPFVGGVVDRIGARAVIIAGIVITVAGVLAMSLIQNLWQFYAVMIVLAIGGSAAGGQVAIVAIATWFEDQRARAMSIMTAGGGLGGLLVVGVAWLVEEFGWRMGLRILALVMLVIGMALAVNVRSRPADHPQPMDGTVGWDNAGLPIQPARRWGIPWRRAVRTRSFLLFSLGLIFFSFGTTALIILQIPYLEDEIGVSKTTAGTSVAVFTVVSIVGRLGLGILADRFSKRWILVLCAVLTVIGLPLLALADSYAMALLAIVLIAPGFGGSIPVRPALLADYFGTTSFGTINGLGALMMTTGGALGPWVVGLVVDYTGEYTNGWYVAAAVVALSIPCFLVSHPPHRLIEEYRATPLGAPSGETAVSAVDIR